MEEALFTLQSKGMQGQALKRYVSARAGGEDISPALSWCNAPEGTKSFAITMYDPDAPTGSGWWHWLAFNIPATVLEIPENAGNVTLELMPFGVIQSINNGDLYGYEGPYPPIGDRAHEYKITVFALRVEIGRASCRERVYVLV